MNDIVASTDCDKIFSKRLGSNSSESWYVLPKWEKLLTIETFNSDNFWVSVIKIVTIRKAFANCKEEYLGKILKI